MAWTVFKNLSYPVHLALAGAVRVVFIAYGMYHDEKFLVPYTDIDYKVFTDAARNVVENGSPYDRHTYRYSPLIAYLLIPNVLVHGAFGKVLFSLIDLLVGVLIRTIVKTTLNEYESYKQKNENVLKINSGNGSHVSKPSIKHFRQRKKGKGQDKRINKSDIDVQADIGMMLWLYNPIAIAIATRGNSDSIAGLLVLLTLYFLQCKRMYFVGGLVHGVSVHFRLYPIVYSLAFFMSLSKYSYYTTNRFKCTKRAVPRNNQIVQNSDKDIALMTEPNKRQTIFKLEYLSYLFPNYDQLKLVVGCLLALSSLTYAFYNVYGYTFLYETYIYHLIRKDTRHNFSVYFYLQYLTAGVKNIGHWQSVLIVLPQVILLLIFSVRYGLNRFSLNFSILTLTITMVTYNTVLTSQYFVWIWVVLPLCLWQIKMSFKSSLLLLSIWCAAQAAWLMPAYFLEFQGQNTFLFIWLQSVSFFCANVAILGRFIMNFMPVKKLKVT